MNICGYNLIYKFENWKCLFLANATCIFRCCLMNHDFKVLYPLFLLLYNYYFLWENKTFALCIGKKPGEADSPCTWALCRSTRKEKNFIKL